MQGTMENTNMSRVKIFSFSALNLQLVNSGLMEVGMPPMRLGNITYSKND